MHAKWTAQISLQQPRPHPNGHPLYGDLDAAKDGPELIRGALLLGDTADGLMPWQGRPEALKRGLIARVPPRELVENQ
jgi:predicted metal-binding protein